MQLMPVGSKQVLVLSFCGPTGNLPLSKDGHVCPSNEKLVPWYFLAPADTEEDCAEHLKGKATSGSTGAGLRMELCHPN